MSDLVKVKIKPGRGIGGYGGPGDVVEMERALAEAYVKDGYVEILAVSEAPSQPPPNAESTHLGEEQDHAIMKPESRRIGKRQKAEGGKK